jgi:NodT family efflux transporter outer membrane factor (OMF) lipoprotein
MTQLETARAQRTELGIQRAEFEHAIAVLTGRPPAELSIPAVAPVQSTIPSFQIGMPSTLLERRPDIAAAERQVAAANEQIGIAEAAFYPTLTLSASGGLENAGINLLTAPTNFWAVGAQVIETLFDAGKRRSQVKLTEAAYDATVANYRQTVLTAFQQVEDNLAQLRILADESEITDRAIKNAQQSLDISTEQYRGGLTNYLQVITAQTNSLDNQRSAVDILTRRMVASVSLIQALGGGWDAAQLPSADELRR